MYKSINDFKKINQRRTKTVKDEKGGLFVVFHSILARCSSHFYQLFSLHGFSNVRQTEIHTAEPLGPEPSAFVAETAIAKIKGNNSPGFDQIPAKLIKAVCRKIRYEIHKLETSVFNKEELSEEWKESIIVPVYKKDDKTDFSNCRGISL